MKKYSWQGIYLSFFSKDFYQDVAKNWKGVGYLYLLLVSLAVSSVTAIVAQVAVNTVLNASVVPTLEKMPKMTLENGGLSIDKESPYIVDLGQDLIVDFDMRKDAQFPADKKGWLVTKTMIKGANVSTKGEKEAEIDISQMASAKPALVIDQETLKFWVGVVKSAVGIIVFIFRTIQLMFVGMIQTLVYGLIGLAVAGAMKLNLTYGTLVRLSAVALTPGLLIETLTVSVGHAIVWWPIASIFVAIGYLIFAVYSNKNDGISGVPPVTTPLA